MNENIEQSSLEDNLPMVNYIMLARIYDILTLIADNIVKDDSVKKMVEYHNSGYILGPAPSLVSDQDDEKLDL